MGGPTSKKQKVVVTPDKMKTVRLRPIRLLTLTFNNIKGRDFMKYCGTQHVQSASSIMAILIFIQLLSHELLSLDAKDRKRCIGGLLNRFVVSSL
jgi:hypothetical protein